MARASLTSPALKDFEAFDKSSQIVIALALQKLETEPHKRGLVLSGNLHPLRRLVVGKKQIRILFTVSNDFENCEIFLIAERRDDKVYDLAAERLAKLDQ